MHAGIVVLLVLIVVCVLTFGGVCLANCYCDDEKTRNGYRVGGGVTLGVTFALMATAVVLCFHQTPADSADSKEILNMVRHYERLGSLESVVGDA